MIGRHVERPEHLFDLEAFSVGRHQEGGDAVSVAGLAAGARKNQVVLRLVNAGIPGLRAVDAPAIAVAHARRLHVGRVGPVLGLGDAECKAHAAFEEPIDPLLLLLFGAVGEHQQDADIVGDDRVLGLKIVVQTKPLDRQMLADNRHAEIGAVLAAVPLWAAGSDSGRPCRRRGAPR